MVPSSLAAHGTVSPKNPKEIRTELTESKPKTSVNGKVVQVPVMYEDRLLILLGNSHKYLLIPVS